MGTPVTVREEWDVAIVGAGPAGSTAALAALQARPDARVLLLDRAVFPRDKACGDGIAPHVVDLLDQLGLPGMLSDWRPVHTLRIARDGQLVERPMARPAWVVPRTVFDARLVDAALGAGAVLRRQRVRTVVADDHGVVLDGEIRARAVIGADGVHSLVRTAAGLAPGRRRAFALRGYAPTTSEGSGRQVIALGGRRQPSYAWSFDRGDGLSNVGYGELLSGNGPGPNRRALLDRLGELLPGAAQGGADWVGHHLPLSDWRWRQPGARILLAGDAAGLVNPMTGEGIYYAVATGVLAGRTVMASLAAAKEAVAGASYRRAVHAVLARHLRHTAVISRLVGVPRVIKSGLRAAVSDQAFFDDLVEIGLGRGLLTARVLRGLVGASR